MCHLRLRERKEGQSPEKPHQHCNLRILQQQRQAPDHFGERRVGFDLGHRDVENRALHGESLERSDLGGVQRGQRVSDHSGTRLDNQHLKRVHRRHCPDVPPQFSVLNSQVQQRRLLGPGGPEVRRLGHPLDPLHVQRALRAGQPRTLHRRPVQPPRQVHSHRL